MANKQVDELQPLSNVDGDYLIPVFNTDSTNSEKIEKVTVNDTLIPKWNPYTGANASPGLVVIQTLVIPVVSIGAPESDLHAAVSAADYIRSVIHNDDTPGSGPPYYYGLNKVGDAPSVIYTDPRDAVVILDCNDLGGILLEVWVRSAVNSTYVEVFATAQDTLALCPP